MAEITGYRIKCHPCNGAVTIVPKDEAHGYWNEAPARYYSFIPCRICGTHRVPQGISGKRGNRKCGAWCTEGTGTTCTCTCGGHNHGTAYAPGVLWSMR